MTLRSHYQCQRGELIILSACYPDSLVSVFNPDWLTKKIGKTESSMVFLLCFMVYHAED